MVLGPVRKEGQGTDQSPLYQSPLYMLFPLASILCYSDIQDTKPNGPISQVYSMTLFVFIESLLMSVNIFPLILMHFGSDL